MTQELTAGEDIKKGQTLLLKKGGVIMRKRETERIWESKGGDIKVYDAQSKMGPCGIVEMLNLTGYVIGAWKYDDEDEQANFYVIGDRLAKQDFSFDIMEAIRFGQNLADEISKEIAGEYKTIDI